MTERIIIDVNKRFGQPCIRGLRITVSDVLQWLAETINQIIEDFPELEAADIKAFLAFAASRQRHTRVVLA